MTSLVVLPHADPTLSIEAPGRRAVALHRQAVDRLTGGEARAALLGLLREHDGPDAVGRIALARATDEVLSGTPAATDRWIAQNVVLTLAGAAASWQVRLRLDDLDLVTGSTESSADVLAAARAAGPFEPELAAAAAHVTDPDAVVHLGHDQQLPALVRLGLLTGAPLAVDGAFAERHWPVVADLLPPGSSLVPTGAVEYVAGTRTTWQRRVDGVTWAGPVSGPELSGSPTRTPPGCAVGVVAVALADRDRVLLADGTALSPDAFRSAVAALHAGGARVVVEFWLGAPGVTEEQLIGTATWLAGQDLPWRIAGARPFHLPSTTRNPPTRWAGADVAVPPTAPGLDLARSAPVVGVPPEHVLGAVTDALSARGRLFPARLAGAYLAPADEPPAQPCLSRGVRVVAVETGHLVVDLLRLRTFAIDSRIGARLAPLAPGVPIAEVLPSTGVRDRVVAVLSSAGVLDGPSEPMGVIR
ncbi:hypothetical protein ACFV4N_39725 [Actinosynnema sp. NPDC059797]